MSCHLSAYGRSILPLLFFCWITSVSSAQRSVHAGGDEAAGEGGTVSFSVGQVVNSLQSENGYTIYAGVQQPYEISVVTGIAEASIQLELIAFPNPVTDQLQLKTSNALQGDGRYQIINLQGATVVEGQIRSNTETITLAGLVSGNYILVVEHNRQILKTFKITKL